MKTFGIGIFGFGYMGKAHAYSHISLPYYYKDLPFKTQLIGVCTSRLETAEAAKAQFGFSFATADLDVLLSSREIDVLHICTPNNLHKEAVMKGAKAGKHLYCDKPLAGSWDDVPEILKTLNMHPVNNQMTFQNRFFPATLRAKQLIEEGRIGRILSFRAAYLHSGSADPDRPAAWRNLKGGGVLLDLGSHVLDLVVHLLGECRAVFARTETLYPTRPTQDGRRIPIETDDMALLMVTLKNGGTGLVEASKIAVGTDDELRLEIHGERGALRFNTMNPNYLEYYDNTLSDRPYGGTKGFTRIECVQRFEAPGGAFVAHKASIGWIRSHIHCLYHFLQCVHEGRPASPSIQEGAYIQYIMEKALESSRKGSWVTL